MVESKKVNVKLRYNRFKLKKFEINIVIVKNWNDNQ